MIDLNECKKGDKLLTSQGLIVEYVCKTPYKHYTYLGHVIKYPEDELGKDNYGTRTNDGFVFAKNRIPSVDNDIIEILNKD